MNRYTFHINSYDIALFATIFIVLTFIALLWFTKGANHAGNRFFALALATMVLCMVRVLGIDVQLGTYLPHWGWLPLQFSLAVGPLIFFYVVTITQPAYKFRRKHLLHFSPLLLQLAAHALEVTENIQTGGPAYNTPMFRRLNAVLQLLAFIMVGIYLYACRRLIRRFYLRQKPNGGDRYLYELRWLQNLLTGFGILWLLWMAITAADYFYYNNQSAVEAYYPPLYLLVAVITIWMAAMAFVRPAISAPAVANTILTPPAPEELKQKATWLTNMVERNLYYQDPELSLSSLAEKVGLHPHEISRIINIALKKNFNDFINEYRIRDVVSKMQDASYDGLTMVGIAFEAGFNSKSTFNRVFREMTGKSAAEFKNSLQNNSPTYHLRLRSRSTAVISIFQTTPKWAEVKLNRYFMFKNYFKIAWRNLARNKTSSFINIGGLAVGSAVALLIGLWIWDELSFNMYHQNYNSIAQVMKNKTINNTIQTQDGQPIPLGPELKLHYGGYFKYIVLSSRTQSHLLAAGDKRLAKRGKFMEAPTPEMLTLNMLKGTRAGLKEPGSILLSSSVSEALFGDGDPMGKLVMLDAKVTVKVTGVYENLPKNTTFSDVGFIAPWDLYVAQYDWPKQAKDGWGYNGFLIFAQTNEQEDMAAVSKHIKDTYRNKFGTFAGNPQLFLQPMSRWHLYSDFKNGVNTSGRAQYIWLFGIIGAFVLLLACINFMNLSTARSEKRAKEVGIRKAMGCLRGQLIGQFFCESFLATGLACLLSILLAQLGLPYFNTLAGKHMAILWGSPLFWALTIGFALLTGLVAGSYPAFYLSSFKPVTVLKGIFKAGRFAALPRRVLVVLQFSISITLIIGTLVVFSQIQYASSRPVGYGREGLVMKEPLTTNLHDHFTAFSNDLLKNGAVTAVAESNSPITEVWDNRSGFEWEGKDPNLTVDFATIAVSKSFGKTVGWQMADGRDFSDAFLSDSSGIILNETAVKLMGLKHPVGATVSQGSYRMHVIGVIKDMLMQNPYEPVKQTIFYLSADDGPVINFKINPALGAAEALTKIGAVVKKYDPEEPLNYQFIDEEYAQKFNDEQRIGRLAASFATLAILISSIGLFGMASFTAEQRVKEIGVRKVLGASVFNLWRLMSKDFVVMVIISLFVATPVAWWVMYNWLQNFTYRTGLQWWVFAVSSLGALLITLLTVSYQSIKAALANPVVALKNE